MNLRNLRFISNYEMERSKAEIWSDRVRLFHEKILIGEGLKAFFLNHWHGQ